MAVQRLQKELRLLAKDPLPSITARPDVKNILVWHYVLEGDAVRVRGRRVSRQNHVSEPVPVPPARDRDGHAERPVPEQHAAVPVDV